MNPLTRFAALIIPALVLSGLVRFISVTFGIALSLFGVLFVAVYLLAHVRKLKAAYLRAAPKRYRSDARELWDAFAYSLTRYLSGLGLDMFAQGALSAVGLFLLGVPYALLLGTWVALTAVIPLAIVASAVSSRRTRGGGRSHHLANKGAAYRPPLPRDTAARRQRLAAGHTGAGPQFALDPHLPGRHSGRGDSGASRGDLRRAHARGPESPLRLLPDPSGDGGLIMHLPEQTPYPQGRALVRKMQTRIESGETTVGEAPGRIERD